MKNFSFLIFLLSFFIALPSNSNPMKEKGKFIKIRKQFEKIDKNGDGLLSKKEMLEAHKDRIDKLFLKFDKNDDKKLSKRELRAVRQEMKKRIDKVRTEGK
jgi:Ca2+-binding EF-hand superfamily protein